jgi:UDP-MurNAc hydroxylase
VRLLWVNHASFVVEHGETRILCDPWLEGTAFDHGLALLAPTRFEASDWAKVTHVWFSHEHPDHFSPYTLRRVPAEVRSRITVLFQRTRDRKVATVCRDLGFRDVQELPAGRWMAVAQGLQVLCQPYEGCDSWLAVRADGQTLVNLNDCRVDTPAKARAVRRKVGDRVDVLLTQFSDADWTGKEEPSAIVRARAAEKLDWIGLQVAVLRPHAVIPCASFMWFCHEENQALNARGNRIADAVRFLSDQPTSTVVLYPGDVWDVGAAHDNAPGITKYLQDGDRALRNGPRVRAPTVPLEDLTRQADAFFTRLRRANGPLTRLFNAWGRHRPARIHVLDLATSFELDDRGLRPIDVAPSACDVLLGSSALSYCFRHPWGGETLTINGRYHVGEGDPAAFFLPFRLATANNHGRHLGTIPFLRLRERLWRATGLR